MRLISCVRGGFFILLLGTIPVWTAIARSPAETIASNVSPGPVPVKLLKDKSGFHLMREGKPYLIKGGGGNGDQKLLATSGGNSIRLWGADDAGPILDEAFKNGLTVALGLWLGHERHGFNYNDADQVARQYEQCREAIVRYKDHPALLIWGIGNEMEGDDRGDKAAIWSAVNNIASLAKRLDPHHPTMTVIADVGGAKVKSIHRLCPDIDIVGLNSYGGVTTLPRRYQDAGGTKPYVVTEFGPPGQWEVQKTSWGAAPELTSTQKAEIYREAYLQAVVRQPLCLGSYAFIWGHKQESTATWFGLLLPDGRRTGAVDVLSELWSGRPPANRCPRIQALKLDGTNQVEPGAAVHVSLDAVDPDGDPIDVEWILAGETTKYGAGGDAEPVPPTFPKAVVRASKTGAELKLPAEPGGYRIYAYVRDDHGGAATANLPMLVKGHTPTTSRPRAKLPLVIYDEGDHASPYAASGWMGNAKAVKLDPSSAENPHAGKTCMRIEYRDNKDWAGVVWQNPSGDWGDAPGGFDLTGAKRLSFWARGAAGGEVVTFEFGLLRRDKAFFDTAAGKLEKIRLTDQWRQYTIDLSGKDLSRIKTPFCWVVAADGQAVTFFLDDICYE